MRGSIMVGGLAAALLLTGCTPADEGHFDEAEPADIVEEGWRAMRALDYVRVEVESPEEDYLWSLDARYGPMGECAGEAVIAGAEDDIGLEFVGMDGLLYVRGDDALWTEAVGADDGQAVSEEIGDRWAVFPENEGPLRGLCDLGGYLDALAGDDRGAEWERGNKRRIGGVGTVLLRHAADSGTSGTRELYVSDTADAHIRSLREEDQWGGRTEVSFSDFDEEFTVEVPDEDDTIDARQVLTDEEDRSSDED